MKKGFATLVLAGIMAAGLSISAFAAGWTENAQGFRWLNDDGSYIANTWHWLDGNGDGVSECYYFNPAGYLMTNSYIDGYQVNGDGCWIMDGVVQTKTADTEGAAQAETGGSAGSIVQTEDYRAMLEAAFEKQELQNDMDADLTMDMSMNMEGFKMDMSMDGTMKVKNASGPDMQYLMDMDMSVLGQDVKTVSFYDDGYVYTDMGGQKMRQALDYDTALASAASNQDILSYNNMDYVENVTGTRNADGTVTIAYSMSGDKLNELIIASLADTAAQDGSVDMMKLTSCTGNITLDGDGNILSESISMAMDMTSEGIAINYVVDMDLKINNAGQPVEFTLPSKEGYTDIPAA